MNMQEILKQIEKIYPTAPGFPVWVKLHTDGSGCIYKTSSWNDTYDIQLFHFTTIEELENHVTERPTETV